MIVTIKCRVNLVGTPSIDFNHASQTNYLFLVFIPRIVQVGPDHQRRTRLQVSQWRKGEMSDQSRESSDEYEEHEGL